MANNFLYAQLQEYSLAGAGAIAGATSITLKSMLDIDGNSLTMAGTFGTIGYGTLEAGNGNQEEQISFTTLTNNSNGTVTLGGVKTVDFTSPYTETSGLAKTHPGSTPFIISNTSGFYNSLTAKNDDETVAGLWTFTQLPVSNGGNATAGTQLITYAQALALATGSASIDRVVVGGTAGETIAVDQLVYLKTSDGRWWLCDADTASTVDNVILGISKGSGTAGNAITNGVHIAGLNTFSGLTLTANTKYYASNTAGGFSSSAGTTAVSLGESQTTTTFLFAPRFGEQLTTVQQSAMAGNNTDVAVGTGNKYVTQTGLQHGAELYAVDTSGSSTAYVAALSPVPTSLTAGMLLFIKFINANTTTTPTLTLTGTATAKTIVKGVNTALLPGDIAAGQTYPVMYDGTNLVLLAPTNIDAPVSYQQLPFVVSSTTNTSINTFQSDQTGSVFFNAYYLNTNEVYIQRIVSDSKTGQMYITNTATWSLSTSVIDSIQVGVTTSYVYVWLRDNGTMKMNRYDIANLANVTTMTISGATGTQQGSAGFSDGTNLYSYRGTANNLQKYTISGTTATFSSNISYTSADFSTYNATCNGTNVYNIEYSGTTVTIHKYALAGGAIVSTTTFILPKGAYPNAGLLSIYIRNPRLLGISFPHTVESNTAVIGSVNEITAITLP